MENLAIQVSNVTKRYKLYDRPILRMKEALSITKKTYHKEFLALQDVSFSVHKGDMYGIIGKNGAGKSTMLKIITGVLTPNAGEVKINGKISALLELGAGFNMEYTGVENIYLNGMMIGYTREEMDAKIDSIIEFADIGDFLDQPVKTYSSGMFARLAFSVAISVEPDILIVDEALSVGDVFFQSKCYKKLNDLKKSGTTILFVTHDMSSVIKYCTKAIVIDAGKLVAEGNPNQMVDLYKKILVGQYDVENDSNHNNAKDRNAIDRNAKDHNVIDLNSSNDNNAVDNIYGEEGVSDTRNNADMNKSWKDYMLLNPTYEQYGDGRAEIIDYGIFDDKGNINSSVIKLRDFTVKMKVQFYTDIDDPILAFSIKDIKGTEITGTNTMIEKIDTSMAKAGTEIIVSFTQKMMLQCGQYLMQFGCTGFDKGNFTVYSRLYNICCLNVIGEKSTVGYFDLDSTVDVQVVSHK